MGNCNYYSTEYLCQKGQKNPCAKNNGGCNKLRKCSNNKGKAVCGKCPTGYLNLGTKNCKVAPLKCRSGSAGNCKVSTIKTPKYSAGRIVRIDNGRAGRRSGDKHSCPAGMKIWSPRNKNDWTIVYNAMGKNINSYPKKPHLIVDVTRPANGCGGCTKYAMKSTTAQQGSWKTKDGSAWWLRDARYNEPNGNYHANCYLHIYDVNPNNVRFDDNNCNFYSTNYLCQPIQKAYRSDFSKNTDGWSCGKITTCGKFGKICGGYGVKGKGAEIKKTYKAPAGAYSVSLDFFKLDSWDNERAYVSVNGKLCYNKVLHYSRGTNVCGHGHGGFKEEKIRVTCKGTLSKAGNLAVRVWTSLNQDARDESFGIDNVVVRSG